MERVAITKEIAEKIFELGGDWQIACKNYSEGIIDKATWSGTPDFDEVWNAIITEAKKSPIQKTGL